MKVNLTENNLIEKEINLLSAETKKSIDVGLINQSVWKQFDQLLVARNEKKLIGACAVIDLGGWLKIGPIIVLSQYQKQGVGRKLLSDVVKKHKDKNLYIGSSHAGVKKIVDRLGFKETSYFKLPRVVKKYLLSYFWQRHSFEFLLDAIKKKLKSKRGKYCFFVKKSITT